MKYIPAIFITLLLVTLACWATFWTPHSVGAAYVFCVTVGALGLIFAMNEGLK